MTKVVLSRSDASSSPTRLLTVDDVAELLNVKRHWVYAHSAELGGLKMWGLLRFSAAILDAWISEQSLAPQR